MAVNDPAYEVDEETWKEFIKVDFVRTGSGKDKKFYVEFTDPSCPNNSVLAYNYATNTEKQENNPFFGFAWQEDIPNPALRQHFNTDKDKVTFYAFKTYGVHIRKNHTRATWRKLEDDWMENGATPPQPRKLQNKKKTGLNILMYTAYKQ